MLFNRSVVNCTAEETPDTNVVFVKVLERHDKLLMSRRFGSMKLKLDWALDGM
jgi:hypothetical protein